MQKYFLSKEEFLKKEIVSHSHHICDVMRMKINDEIIISVEGKPYIVNLSFISSEKCCFKLGNGILKQNNIKKQR